VVQLRAGGEVTFAAYPAPADLVGNLAEGGTMPAALAGVDVVINAAGVEDRGVVRPLPVNCR